MGAVAAQLSWENDETTGRWLLFWKALVPMKIV